ncbi:MAG: choice-of-anchor K domain-containing protein [Leptolyngbya sp. SIO1E4]|nr:choice-of-anchor K domain-containing protein [Leptolyngbya sp. SIO1E4]
MPPSTIANTSAPLIPITSLIPSVTASTSGIWTSVKDKGNAAKSRLSGIDTSQVNWGVPYPPDNPQNRQSAYRFDGLTQAVLTLDGEDCLLGTFTHFNYTITGDYSISAAVLKLTVVIQGAGTKEFNVSFQHNETPNDPGPVPDIVSIPEITSQEKVTIQGKVYALTITGFLQGGKVTRNFRTAESRDNKAEIYGKLVLIEESPPTVVEPITVPPCYVVVCPPCPCPPPVQPIYVTGQPIGVIPGTLGPTVIGGGKPGPTVIGGGKPNPTVIGGGITGPTVINGGKPGPTVIGGGITGPTVIGGGTTGQTIIGGGGRPGTIFPGGTTGPTITGGGAGTVIGGGTGAVIGGGTGTVIGGGTGTVIGGGTGAVIGGGTGTVTQQISSVVFSISSFGIWLNVLETVSGSTYLKGIGTNQISWGNPVSQGNQSAYYFEGITTTSISLDGSYFTLGTFTHYNYPVYGYGIRSAILQLTVKINGVDVNFNFQFNHNEVPNNGINGVCPLTPDFSPPCPDVVSISNNYSQETVTIGGKQYVLCIVGFFQNNQIESKFITLENQVNVAQILCQLVELKMPSAAVGAS